MKPRRLGRGLSDLGGAVAGVPGLAFGRGSAPPAVSDQGQARYPRPTLICVTSGKGGTGKSVLTSNLAVHLTAGNVRTITVDADMGLANLHLLLGMRPSRTLLDVVERGALLEEIAETGPTGVRLAAGGSGLPELADMHPSRLYRLVAAMEAVGDGTEIVLVDTGAGIGRATTTFLYAIPNVLVVTTPDLTAMTDAYALIKNVARNNAPARVYLVVNHATSAVEGLEIFRRMDQIARKFLSCSLRYLGHILEDQRIPASVAARVPILLNQPAAPAAACLRGIGRSLMLEIAQRRAASVRTAG